MNDKTDAKNEIDSAGRRIQTEAGSPLLRPPVRSGLQIKTKMGDEVTLEELFILKCKLCTAIFSIDSREPAKESKRITLLELIELMDGEANDPGLTQARNTIMKSTKAMEEMFTMIKTNLIRTPK